MSATSTMDNFDNLKDEAKVFELIEQAKALVESGKKLPLSGRALVDRESLVKALDEIRSALPLDLKLASQVMERRQRIINQAMAESRRIMMANAAELEAQAKQHNLVVTAQKRAEEIIMQAESQVRSMLADSRQITVPPQVSPKFWIWLKERIRWFISLFVRRQ